MTEKLYYLDSHLASFQAEVISCTQTEKGFEVVLDRTAFYPLGGGHSKFPVILWSHSLTQPHDGEDTGILAILYAGRAKAGEMYPQLITKT